jgi:hypothetical protein
MKPGHLDLRVEQALIDKIEAWRNAQPIRPSRAKAVSHILDDWLKHHVTYAPSLIPVERPLKPMRR